MEGQSVAKPRAARGIGVLYAKFVYNLCILERFKPILHAGFDIDLKYITIIHASAPREFPCYFARRELHG